MESEIIDLTESPPSTPLPLSGHVPLTNGRPPPKPLLPVIPQAEEPPTKRRRVENDQAKLACQQASTYVSRAITLNGISDKEYWVSTIAVQAIITLAEDPTFISRLNDSNGFQLSLNNAWAVAKAKETVAALALQPKYSKRPVTENASEQTNPRPPFVKTATDIIPQPTIVTEIPPPIPLVQKHISRAGYRGAWTGSSNPRASSNIWFNLEQRPYQSAADRQLITTGVKYLRLDSKDHVRKPAVYHVDFTADEVKAIFAKASEYLPEGVPHTIESLTRLCHQGYNIPSFVGNGIRHRTTEDIRNFCSDLLAGVAGPASEGRVLTLQQQNTDKRASQTHQNGKRATRVASLLLAREIEGNRGFGRMRRYENFQNEFKKAHEDCLTLIAEFTDCAGDIATTTWVPDNNILCGTTAHSDTHNQQYNKPGNLLLCSTTLGQLRAFPDHRIPRPLVEKGENSTEAMRQSQDPWLYSSVVSSDYDKICGLAYTSSFDKTVKVWRVDPDGRSMTALATWHFDGNVNFVAAAKDGSGRVAAAADVPTEAVRIYTVNMDDIANSPYQSFSCSRKDAEGSGKWAYFPATMQWGQGIGTQHLLAVGYSPRSLTGDDRDIPEDRHSSGEITLWDAAIGDRVPVMTATTANFFEVVWHPVLQSFIAATSPCGLKVTPGVRTQVHLFRIQDGAYSEYQSLDCPASDINELTFMPNSLGHAYVTAACTDGNVYVWDTAQGDVPIHVLNHGPPLDEYYEDREREDTGVKFTAWGRSLDRFYTGASDGVVKVWNVRNQHQPYVRDLLEAPGPISCGAFAPDLTKLVVGDATGRVFVFSLDKRDEPRAHFMTVPGLDRKLRRPMPFIPHAEPPPPDGDPDAIVEDDSDQPIAVLARQAYLNTRQLVLHPNPVIGAVQGPEYASTGLFRREAHLGDDPAGPLITTFERQQRESVLSSRGARSRSVRRLKEPGEPTAESQTRHVVNKAQDLDVHSLARDELDDLIKAGAELSLEEDWGLVYEEMPINDIEGNS